MKYLFLFFAMFTFNFAIAQDYEILDAIDTINHELDSSAIFSIDEDGMLTIQQLEEETTYTFSLKGLKDINHEFQFSFLVLHFFCYKEEACFYDRKDVFELLKEQTFSILLIEISPKADGERIVQELLFIKSRL